ncbi:MAG TPA: Holliday junction resolvase RuvX [Solirubrobacteraceae bacterium]|nr:Holliday junction resolvase RuvX [Solirubrobacteraceae bacterium]
MRVLALDYGSTRCGCALSDPTGTIVTPIEPVLRPSSRAGMAALSTLAVEREAELVLIGLPLSLNGQDSEQTRETRAFAERLGKRVSAPVELYDERFTTRIAARSAGAGSSEDSRAAAVLLEDWLSRRA